MTFYWWSHWFWITLLSTLILFNIVIVHTYPSQESTLEYNSNQEESPKKLVTKLHQTSTITWATNVSTNRGKSIAMEKLKLQHVKQTYEKSGGIAATSPYNGKENAPTDHNEKEEDEYYYDYDAKEEGEEEEDKPKRVDLAEMEKDLERRENNSASLEGKQHEIDVKRSTQDVQNKTVAGIEDETKLLNASSTTKQAVVEPNNYTNFTVTNNTSNSTNTIAVAAAANVAKEKNATSSNTNTNTTTSTTTIITTNTTTTNTSDNTIKNTTTQTFISNLTTQLPQVPATPKIVKSQTANLDWLNTIAAQITPDHVTTDVTSDSRGEPHKIPYTLENVNKPEDLMRREEGEHRTRKSKGLSADYKVNRYINYSSDSKNLLTRSAATTVNEYDSEESNISSEALSVQRAYFMDVGAISAICFTVFGICCTVGTVGIVLYRRRFLNKPQALSEPDSSVYIDDSTMRVSDNSDEMYSLDNDSFLNSLEAMTIQNYWTDTVKHTKL